MKLDDIINEGKYAHLATSFGVSEKEIKAYLKKLDGDGTMAKIIEDAKKADDYDAYKWGTVRKILAARFGKNR